MKWNEKERGAVDRFIGDVWSALHEAHGICGHCGKLKCPGRAQHSELTRSVTPEQLERAFAVARKRRFSDASRTAETPQGEGE